jgi:hypothetical protein
MLNNAKPRLLHTTSLYGATWLQLPNSIFGLADVSRTHRTYRKELNRPDFEPYGFDFGLREHRRASCSKRLQGEKVGVMWVSTAA